MKHILPTVILCAALMSGCGSKDEETPVFSVNEEFLFMRHEGANPYDQPEIKMPDNGRKMKIRPIGGSLGKVFADLNDLHLEAARSSGFQPLVSVADAWNTTSGVVKIESNDMYCLEKLTHSLPYLTEGASAALDAIAAAFRDSIVARGGGGYRPLVTSVLRTPETISGLRRRNRNATMNSAHLFGTTFDISYLRFACDNDTMPRTQEDLKNLLGEVLADQRNLGRIYVKFERKQGCFHITAR